MTGALVIVALVIVAGIAYGMHRSYFNKRVCRRCKGTGKVSGGWGTFRDCPVCNRKGEVMR